MVYSPSPAEVFLAQRRLPVPPEKVFDAFTDASRLVRWFAPVAEWDTKVHELDARVGGAYRIDMVEPSGNAHKLHGNYLEVRRPDLLLFTWRWEGSDEETVVRVEIVQAKGGCELNIAHERFTSAASKQDHAQGWEGCLARLETLLGASHP